MRRLFCIFLCLVLLSGLAVSAKAADVTPLSDRVQKFLFDNDLDSSNFALSYYNTDTDESYSFNQNACFPAGNLWKLPLHMYYYEQESLGTYDPPPEDPYYVFTVGGMTLEECRYQSIILGDNNVAVKMRDLMGSYEQFKMTVNEAFGHVPEQDLPEEFYKENIFSTQFWINTLIDISKQPDLFQNMMRNYNMVQTADGFAAYDKTYPLIHIRGEENGFVCDVGEIRGPETYLLVCCVSEEAGGDEILAKINTLVCSYVEDRANVANTAGGSAIHGGDSPMDIASGVNKDKSSALIWMGIALGGALVLAGILAVIFWLLRRRKDDYYD